VKNPFWNRDERRLRAGWRILLLLVATAVASFLAYGPLAAIPGVAGRGVRFAYLILAFLALWAVARFIDRRSLADLGLSGRDRGDFLAGFAMSVGVIGLLALAFRALGWVEWEVRPATESSLPLWLSLAVQLLLFAVAAVYEETLSRGYLIRNLAEGWNSGGRSRPWALGAAWIVSSLLFALMHAANPEAGRLGFVNLTLLGAIFALPFLARGALAMPVGLHLGWNLAIGPLLGLPVSGGAPPVSLLAAGVRGPERWLGGAFGPESGLGATAAALVLAVLVVVWLRWRHPEVAGVERRA